MEYSVLKALSKAQKYCAYQERSQQEVRDKLYSFGLHRNEVENLITELIDSGFLKESRFATAFAGGKFRVKKWGKVKIRRALEEKKVSEPLIRKALSEIEERDYKTALKELIKAHSKKVVEPNAFKRKYKIASFAIRRGFEAEMVWEVVNDYFSDI